MPAPLDNTNAAKPAAERRTEKLWLRVRASDRARWTQAAHFAEVPLATWACDALNRAARRAERAMRTSADVREVANVE